MERLASAFNLGAPAFAAAWLISVWEGTALALVLLLVLRGMRRVSAASRSYVIAAAMLLVAGLPAIKMLQARPGTLTTPVWHAERSWSLWLACTWLVLALVNGAVLVRNVFRLVGMARRATEIETDPLITAMLTGKRRKTTLCASAEVKRPQVIGFLCPRILLPVGLAERLSAVELRQVVRHELQHLRRGDDWINLLQQVSLVLLPLHPGLMWLNRQLCRERELACDDEVLRAENPRTYAACLVKLAEDTLRRKGTALALSLLGSEVVMGVRESELAARVRRILRGPAASAGVWARFAPAAAVTLTLAAAGMLMRLPEVVRFDAVPGGVSLAQMTAPALGRPDDVAPVSRALGAIMPVRANLASGRNGDYRMVATKAVMDGASPRRFAATTSRRRRPAVLASTVFSRSRGGLSGKPRMVQAVDHPVLRPAQRVWPVKMEVLQPVYAAVPVQGGWLIVQL